MVRQQANSAQAIPSYLREINERRVLDALRANGPVHAAEVARLSGLSRPTAAQILRSLVEVGLVREQFPSEDDPRRARAMYSAAEDLGALLSIDIGARFIRAAIGDLNGQIKSTVSRQLSAPDLPALISSMKEAVAEALSNSGFEFSDVISVVVGSPGVVDRQTGRVALAGAVSALEGVHLAEVVGETFNCTPIVENDVNLVAIAEQTFGAAQGVDNFAVLSVGSGIGAGLVLNGQLLRGSRGAAGEIFYVPFGDEKDLSHRSSDPSASNVRNIAEKLAGDFKKTRLVPPYEPIEIFEAARYKDPLAVAVVAEVARRIALYVSTITAVADVELVVLGGGIGRQADVLLAEIQAVVARIVPFAPRIEVSSLGDSAVLLGSMALCSRVAQDAVFAQRSHAYSAARDQGLDDA